MKSYSLEPEFFVDFLGNINTGPLIIDQGIIKADFADANDKEISTRVRLKNHVVMPGFVNCHSHIFQRGLRGLVEKRSPDHDQDDFWLWRERMYRLVEKLGPDDLLPLAELGYLEMLEAGFTHVGEFHYLHHDDGGIAYDDPLLMSRALAKAAHNAHINLRLLETAYHRRDFENPLSKPQLRFGMSDADHFLSHARLAARTLTSDIVQVGLAIHSVRAVPETWFRTINEMAITENMPLHVHVSEQIKDVNDCLAKTGLSPIALLDKYELLAPHTTLVHATHLIKNDVALIKNGRPHVCICPSTEKNLGDGVIPLYDLHQNGTNICLGTDQHVRFDPFNEACSLEEQERSRLRKRGILNAPGQYLYKALIPCLTGAGMTSLYPGTSCGSLVGAAANLIAVELPPEFEWHGPEAALDALMIAGGPAQITDVMVKGQFVVQNKKLINDNKSELIQRLKPLFKDNL